MTAMLKTVIFCLVVASLLLLGGAYFALTPPILAAGKADTMLLDIRAGKAVAGSGAFRQGAFRLRLDAAGQGVVVLPAGDFPLEEYPYVQLDLRNAITADRLSLMWRADTPGRETFLAKLTPRSTKTISVRMTDTAGWRGIAESIAVYVAGEPGALVSLVRINLARPTFGRYLGTVFRDWTAYRPWTHSAVNLQPGVTQSATSLYPVPVMAALFVLALTVYGLVLKPAAFASHFDARVATALFLVTWLVLDLSWQANLVQQLSVTYDRFAGKSSDAKLRSGPDGALYRFTRDAIPLIDTQDARIFVGSAQEYLAMRGAYYFYPLNAFWERHAEEFPERRYFHPGDYLVLLNPTRLIVDERSGQLSLPDGSQLPVETLLKRPQGRLLRVL
jgi:hypothetical protein